MRYAIETVTGAELVDAAGRATGPESTGRVVSQHRTREAAEKALESYRRACPLGQAAIFERSGK